MKTFYAIAITAVVTGAITWFELSTVYGVKLGVDRLWLMSAVKAPGRMALDEIQADMNAGRYQIAKAKLDALMDTWQRFDAKPAAFRGAGLGDIMTVFSKLDTNAVVEQPTQASHP